MILTEDVVSVEVELSWAALTWDKRAGFGVGDPAGTFHLSLTSWSVVEPPSVPPAVEVVVVVVVLVSL